MTHLDDRTMTSSGFYVSQEAPIHSDNPIPTPPFWGTRVVKGIPLAEYVSMLDERATFLERSRRGKRHAAQGGAVSVLTGAPILFRLLRRRGRGGRRWRGRGH